MGLEQLKFSIVCWGTIDWEHWFVVSIKFTYTSQPRNSTLELSAPDTSDYSDHSYPKTGTRMFIAGLFRIAKY